ncbi:TetR family transcriptional regulator [Kushneria sinocarnis]|uniref:TetR family transcriptional regulator n=1 Tax=Kushneria sinocarnis TaxID=595502 RepID=A0A420X003_9GAMM|nr:TetR/AcrR family transcriptional regulator [Kushneria sinocarnis]RKR06847.1 TetR family transcriptional regulator [Kushneria sinocarnis]
MTTTEERIRAAGLRLFAEQGYEATPLSMIAGEVGIRTPSLYNHFDSKEALFMALAEEVEADMLAHFSRSIARYAEQPVRDRLHALIVDTSDFIFQQHRGVFYKRFLLFPPPALKEALAAINQDSERYIDRLLLELFHEGQRRGELRALDERAFVSALYCLVDGLFSERFLYAREEFDRRLEGAWTVFWAGVCA